MQVISERAAGQVWVLGTGGTIAGRASQALDNVGYRAGEVGVDELLAPVLASVPEAGRVAVESFQVAQVDSKDMGPDVWWPLLARVEQGLADPQVRAIVITHGTDTIEETAVLLAWALRPLKPVVLACAMRPASALAPDGPQNLRDAMAVALDPAAAGVWVVAAGWVHAGTAVSKVHPYRVDAFSSGDAGASGCVEEGRVRWLGLPVAQPGPLGAEDRIDWSAWRPPVPWPAVDWVVSHAGADGRVVDALCAASPDARPLQGLVVAGTGNGTVHRGLRVALERAAAQGVEVWLTSRCANGQVVASPHAHGGLKAVPWAPAKARVALMLHLMRALPGGAGVGAG